MTNRTGRAIRMFGLHDVLFELRLWQAKRGVGVSGYVFPNKDGGVIARWGINEREFDRKLAAAELPEFTIYGFRHMFATLHLQSDDTVQVDSELLGHCNLQQTANTCQQLSSGVSMDFAERHVR